MAVVQAMCSSPASCCCLFALFLVIIINTSPRRRRGIGKGMELNQSILLLRSNRSRGAGKEPVELMTVFSTLEPGYHGGVRRQGPRQLGETRGYLIDSVVDDNLMRVWENIPNR